VKRELDPIVTTVDSTMHITHRLRILPLLLLCVSFLVGCDADPTPVAVATTPPPPTATHSPTITPTPVPTHTPSPSPTPTTTPTPTASPTPTPLPGTNLIAFESYRNGDGEIYLLDTQTGRLTNLTRHPAEDRAPAWRPDGRAIAFESRRDGNWDIYVLDLADGLLTRLTEHPAYDGAPAWSPDGSAVAFESYRDGNLEIYAVAASGGQPRRLTQDPGGDYGPAWSPDGAHIAFTSWRDGNKELYVMSEGGGEILNLTQDPADDEDPVWSPDGSALAFVSWRDVDPATRNRNAEIYRLDMVGGAIERLTDNPWPDLDPAWDIEGRLIWAAYDPGEPFETYDPYRPGDFHLYRAGEEEDAGLRAPQRLTGTNWDDRRPAAAPAQVADLERLAQLLLAEPPTLTPQPTLPPDQRVEVVEVPSILASYSEQPIRVNERGAPSLAA